MNPTIDPSAAQPADTNLPPSGDGQLPAQNPAQFQAGVQPSGQPAAMPMPVPPTAAQPGAPAPQMADPAGTQTPQNAQASPADDVTATTKNVTAKIIDDKDLIEKEYVDKARKIVEANRGDPYKQSEQLTAFRAEYMQKEYNKTIKTDK